MIPNNYARKKLKSLLGIDQYRLYHWTSLAAAVEILKSGYILSKGTLFGYHHFSNKQLLNNINPKDAKNDAKNGFIDYVFLGNTNWSEEENYSSKYGEVAFEIRPESILLFKDFLVYPFNTGWYFSTKDDSEKTSDISILLQALNKAHPCFEILVRRSIKISNKKISRIICPSENVKDLSTILKDKSITVSSCETANMTNQKTIIVKNPYNDFKSMTYDHYIQKGNYIYLKTPSSHCMLTLEIQPNGDLTDSETGEVLGRFAEKYCFS